MTYSLPSFSLIYHEILAAGFEFNASHVSVKFSFGLNVTDSPLMIFKELGAPLERMKKGNMN